MKQNKWILPAICTCTGFFAGLATGMSILGHKKKTSPEALPEDVNAEMSDATVEEVHDE